MGNFLESQKGWKMEMEKCKVEINEIDLRFCLFHILIMVLPCAFSNVLGIYINLEKKVIELQKWLVWVQNM
jgi:hypothetical protein